MALHVVPLSVDFIKSLYPRYIVDGLTGSRSTGLTQAPSVPVEGVIEVQLLPPFVDL